MPSSSSSTAVLVAGSAALLVAGIGMLSQFQQQSTITDIDDMHEDDFITEQEVVKIFDRLFLEMQGVFSQLMQQVQQLQQMGQRIPQKQLEQLIRSEMERALAVKQQTVLDQFDIDYDCLEEATWEFLEDEEKYPKVKRAVEKFQKLWENATGDDVVGWRPGKESGSASRTPEELLSPEQTVAMAEIYFTALTENMRTLVARFQAEGKNMQDPSVQQELNMEFAAGANDAGEAALAAQNVTMNQFEQSVKSHSSNPTVGRALAMLQMQQQQDLMSIGGSAS